MYTKNRTSFFDIANKTVLPTGKGAENWARDHGAAGKGKGKGMGGRKRRSDDVILTQ